MNYFKTPEVADMLKISYWQLINLLRGRKIPMPMKDSSGDYIWQEPDINAAKKVLTHRGGRRVSQGD